MILRVFGKELKITSLSIKSNKAALDLVIWVLLSLNLLIDSLNGFFVLSLGIDIKISVLAKMISIILMFVRLTYSRLKYINTILLMTIILLIPVIFRVLFFDRYEISIDLIFVSRVVYLFVLFFYVKNHSTNFSLHLVLLSSTFVLTINVLIGYVGLGFHTYGSTQIGYKGYFYAGNELSAVFVILATYALCYFYKDKLNFTTLKCWLFVVFIGISIGTKTTIIYPFIILSVLFLRKNQLTGALYLFIFISLSIVLVSAYLPEIQASRIGERIAYVYNQGSLLDVIFSSRNIWFSQLVDAMENRSTPNVILGIGSSELRDIIGKHTLEIDPVDVWVCFGIAGLIIPLFHMYLIFSAYRITRSEFSSGILITNIVLLILAFSSGHIWTSGMMATVWVVFNAFLYANSRENNTELI